MRLKDMRPASATERFQPDERHTYNHNKDYRIDQGALALWVGLVAISLPIILVTWASVSGACDRDSISAYYYSRWTGDLFVVMLAFIGTFLIAYRGENRWENWLATGAGLSAFGVALFPTSDSGCDLEGYDGRLFARIVTEEGNIWVERFTDNEGRFDVSGHFALAPWTGDAHYLCAFLLFGFLAYYCLRVFTRVVPERHRTDEGLRRGKALANAVYYLSGGIISAALLAMVLRALAWDPEFWARVNATFWLETLAIFAFGVSWLVKGARQRWFVTDASPRAGAGGDASLSRA